MQESAVSPEGDGAKVVPYEVSLFRSIFRGREDTYGTYNPTTQDQWTVHEPVTDEVIRAHLEGVKPLGVFLLQQDCSVSFGVIDIDVDDMELVKRCVEYFKALNLPLYVERSKRKGYHLWLFLHEAIEAKKVRMLINGLLKEIDVRTEVFPKQDAPSPSAEYGNYINLPLFGFYVKQGKTVFLNPADNWKPYQDQWSFLRDCICYVPEELVERIIADKKLYQEVTRFTLSPSQDSGLGGSSRPLPPCAFKALTEGVQEGMRDVWAFRLAVHLRRVGMPREAIAATLRDWNATKVTPSLPNDQILKKVEQAFKGGYTSFGCDDPLVKQMCEGRCVFENQGALSPQASLATSPISIPDPLSMPFSELMLREEHVTWLVEGLLEAGVIGFVAGEPKVTKSWFALGLGLCLATGYMFLGKYKPTKAYKVLYAQEEDGYALVKDRIARLIKGGIPTPDDANFRVIVRAGIKVDIQEYLLALEKELESFHPDLIIFDVFSKLHLKDENSQPEMTQVMQAFEGLRRKFGCTILIVHHFRKSAPGGSFRGNQRMRGSSVLSGWSENSFYITQAKGVYKVEFESKSTTADPFCYALEEIPSEDGQASAIRIVAKDAPLDDKVQQNKEAVLQAVIHAAESGDLEKSTVASIKTAAHVSEKTARSILNDYVEKNEVQIQQYRPSGKKTGRSLNAYLPTPSKEGDE